jgi:hypothetical protein
MVIRPANPFQAACLALLVGLGLTVPSSHQAAIAQVPPQNSETEEIRVERTRFAPGTVRVIPPAPLPEETYSGPLTIENLLQLHPEIEWSEPDFPEGKPFFDTRSRTLIEQARDVILRREIFCFEFSFKPLRQMYIDVPQPGGKMERKLVWYMVYRVRYQGGDLRPAKAADSTAAVDELYSRIEKVSYRQRHLFTLAVLEDAEANISYRNQIIPVATAPIRAREKITAPLYNAVEITEVPITLSEDPAADGVWGVFTWTDVNPSADFLSMYVFGLTNAFQKTRENGEEVLLKKALQLNFYRPGDVVRETEDRIRFGVPTFTNPDEQAYVLKQYGLEKRLDYQWVYR